jgi:hypothetical protein
MSQTLRLASLATVLALLASVPAAATLVVLDDCDASGCQGSSVSLEASQTSPGIYHVTLTLDSTGFDESRDGVNQAGFKAVEGFTSVSLLSAPTAGWSVPISAPINSNCDVCGTSPSPSDQICTAGFVDITANDQYTWEFEVVGGSLLPTSDWHIGFQYANGPGPARGKIVSAQGTAVVPVPEPSAALAFAVGLGVVGLRLGRRRHEA